MTMALGRLLLAGSVLGLALSACNDAEDAVKGHAGGAAAGGTSAGGKSGGADQGGTTTAGDAGSATHAGEGGNEGGAGGDAGGAGGAVDCSVFEDGATNSVEVKLVNATDAPIFIAGGTRCSEPQYLGVTDVNGENLGGFDQCRTPCSQVASSGTIDFCEPLCGNQTIIQLEPGATMTTSWEGRDLVSTKLPKACQLDVEDPNYGYAQFCRVWRTVGPGTYQFEAKAGTRANCGQGATSVAQLPHCYAVGDGACEQESCDPSGSLLEATASLELTSDLRSPSVKLVFQP